MMPLRLGALALACLLVGGATASGAGTPAHVDQGAAWSPDLAAAYYKVDQGSRMIPLAWLKALQQPDGSPFLAGALTRYGYLPSADGGDLPIGFTVAGTGADATVGMTCAACHTRELMAEGKSWRIDGGPAFADFGALLVDLDAAVARVLTDDAAFTSFANDVLGGAATPADRDALRKAVDAWHARNHAWTALSQPKRPWGPGRLDAISMIFNRLAGLDLGATPDAIVADNIKPADAPARYPFLWNAPRQDFSQWAGFTENGNDELGTARNLGEVYGVYAMFHPRPLPAPASATARDFLTGNSASIAGLAQAEGLLRRLGPPVWPWPVDQALAKQGAEIFARSAADGGCAECHAAVPGAPRPHATDTLRTVIRDVGTDTRQWQVLLRPVATGTLAGATSEPGASPLRPVEPALAVLRVAVVGTLQQVQAASRPMPPTAMSSLHGVMKMRMAPAPAGAPAQPVVGAYEARALLGIWAAAPYLHNGSVPTLADLLLPADERPRAFKLGPAYDIEKVGLATVQPSVDFTLTTTGCDDRASGDSRCGHEYGTRLSPKEKRALLEYLKTL